MSQHCAILEITNKRGLHARASASLASLATRYPCTVRLGHNEQQLCDAKNILEVMMLAASPGSRLHLQTEGEQAAEALAAICQLAADHFHEEPNTL